MVTVSLPIDEARFQALTARAARIAKPVESMLLDAVDDVLDEEAAYVAAVHEGLIDIDNDNVVDGAVVFSEIKGIRENLKR